MATGLYYTPRFLNHELPRHPESPERLAAAWAQLEEQGVLLDVQLCDPDPLEPAELERVHAVAHVRRVRELAEAGGGRIDADTFVGPQSYDIALRAAGAAVQATSAVLAGRQQNAFALIRPPGHHALRDRSMGFCLFNNVAVAAASALATGGAQRVLIVDFDVHHGNGTQDIYYEHGAVVMLSTHQWPLYPGTGRVQETGAGHGRGCIVNLPLPPGCDDAVYRRAFDEVLVPLARRTQPDLILVSAGYDAHWADPLANMRLTVDGYVDLMERLCGLAHELCDGRLVAVLEGGYRLEAVAAAVVSSCQVLSGQPAVGDPMGRPPVLPTPPEADRVLAAVRETHGLA